MVAFGVIIIRLSMNMQQHLSSWIGRLWMPNFHADGSSARVRLSDSLEPVGSSSSRIPCMSWNKGRCTAPYMLCLTHIVAAHELVLIALWSVARRNPRGLMASRDRAHHLPLNSLITSNCMEGFRSQLKLKRPVVL